MARKKKRFEVWGLVDGEWQAANRFETLVEADANCRNLIGIKGLLAIRMIDNEGKVAPREYSCGVAA